MINKKGQVQMLVPAILGLIFAAIILVFGLVMIQELTDTREGTVSTSIANESIAAWVSGVNQTLAGNSTCGFGSDVTSVVIYNTTNDLLIASGNYTAYPNGNIINLTTNNLSLYPWQVSYSYTWGDEACIAGNSTTQGLGTFADFWEIIVLAIVITIVIGLLLVVFGGGRRTR